MSISFASLSSLRRMAKGLPFITDEELDEVRTLIDFDRYFDDEKYELSGHFILTKDEDLWHNEVDRMCCGIIAFREELSNGQMIYFAFDYGH